jgi:hypothetical protein
MVIDGCFASGDIRVQGAGICILVRDSQKIIDAHVESTLVSIPTVFFKQLFRVINRRAKVGRFAINLDYNKIMSFT